MAGTTFIYGLTDPRTQQLRYVGKANNPNHRYKGHLAEISRTYKSNWVASLRNQNKVPEMVILEEVPKTEWEEAEIWWIAYAKSLGAKLTNKCTGGGISDGYRGHKHPPETIARMSEIKKGKVFDPDHKAKIAAKRKAAWERREAVNGTKATGRKHTEETKAKMRANSARKGKPCSEANLKALRERVITEETRAKLSNSLKGRVITEEWRENISKATKGVKKPHSEEHKAAIKAGWILRKARAEALKNGQGN